MSFYVTLPSNSSQKDFPNNTLTKYTTKLKTPIKLDSQYEVALVEIMYPFNFKLRNDGKIIVTATNVAEIVCEVSFYVYENISKVADYVTDYFKKTPIQIEMAYNQKAQKVFINIPKGVIVNFTDGINNEFGFKRNILEGDKQKTFFGDFKIRNDVHPISSLYVYSDIVEYQIVGDVNAPLLQVVPTFQSSSNLYVHKIYDAPHYVPVSRSNIETIEINILTDLGDPVYFSSGKLIIKLHFRRKSFY
jgi:hypothetical protein